MTTTRHELRHDAGLGLRILGSAVLIVGPLVHCTYEDPNPTPSTAERQSEVEIDFRAYLDEQLVASYEALARLQQSAPVADADGWTPALDLLALDTMRDAWHDAHAAHVAIAPSLAALGIVEALAIDPGYETFAIQTDLAAFDAVGVTGLHAIERILWADSHPAKVASFEQTLAHYQAPAYPRSFDEAVAFQTQLVQKTLDDLALVRARLTATQLDPAVAYRALEASLQAQLQALSVPAPGGDEARYGQRTLAPLLALLEASEELYDLLSWWHRDQEHSAVPHALIVNSLYQVRLLYEQYGHQLPPVPNSWDDGQHPGPAALATDYGKLWSRLAAENDPTLPNSLVTHFRTMGQLLGISGVPPTPYSDAHTGPSARQGHRAVLTSRTDWNHCTNCPSTTCSACRRP